MKRAIEQFLVLEPDGTVRRSPDRPTHPIYYEVLTCGHVMIPRVDQFKRISKTQSRICPKCTED